MHKTLLTLIGNGTEFLSSIDNSKFTALLFLVFVKIPVLVGKIKVLFPKFVVHGVYAYHTSKQRTVDTSLDREYNNQEQIKISIG